MQYNLWLFFITAGILLHPVSPQSILINQLSSMITKVLVRVMGVLLYIIVFVLRDMFWLKWLLECVAS